MTELSLSRFRAYAIPHLPTYPVSPELSFGVQSAEQCFFFKRDPRLSNQTWLVLRQLHGANQGDYANPCPKPDGL